MQFHLKAFKDIIVENLYEMSIKGSYRTELSIVYRKIFGKTLKLYFYLPERGILHTTKGGPGPYLVCNSHMPNGEFTHFYLECSNLPRQIKEDQLWSLLNVFDTELTDHLKSLVKQDLMEHLLGYHQFNDNVMNNVILQSAVFFLSR
jgi:hypothetical protein